MSGPDTPFTPGDVVLELYTFLSYVRTGLAAAAGDPAAGAVRTGVDIIVPILVDGQPGEEAVQRLELRGPGDVLRIDERQVVRRYPAAGAVGVEPNYLAHVEFDRSDLPWLFTPRAANPAGQLPPWLVLVVLEDGQYEPQPPRPGFVPVVRTRHSELQPLTDSWAYAHAQVLGPAGDPASVRRRLTDEYGLVNLSRLLCPRRLRPDRGYLACVVPAYQAGVRAALGESEQGWTLDPAWTREAGDGETEITLPVLHSWWFSTGAEGDFEDLARRLHPMRADWPLERAVDTSHPWPGAAVDAGRVQPVAGPLVAPSRPAAQPGWSAAVTDELRSRLNQPAEQADRQPAPGDDGVPLVGPPIYGGPHTSRRRVGPEHDGDWFGQLNLRPAHRIVAGLATRVVQHDQETLMQAAWTQLGDLAGINAQLRQAQLARFVGDSLHRRHVRPLPLGDLMQVIRPVHADLTPMPASATSVRDALFGSSTAPAASTSEFRRVTARQAPGEQLALGDAPRDFQRPYDDRWLTGMSPQAAATVSPYAIEQATGQPGAGPDQLIDLAQAVAATPTVTDALTMALTLPNPGPLLIDPESTIEPWVARRHLDQVLAALPADPTGERDRAAALLGPLAALAKATGDATARTAADTLLRTADAVDRGPSEPDLAAAATANLSADVLADTVRVDGAELADVLDVAALAAVARACADQPLLVEAAKDSQQVLVAAAHEYLDLDAFATAAAQLVEATTPPTGGLTEVVVNPVGTGEVIVDPARGGDVTQAEPPGSTESMGLSEIDEEVDLGTLGIDLNGNGIDRGGIDPGGTDPGGIDPGGIDPGMSRVGELELLEVLELPPDELALLATGDRPPELMAKLAVGCLEDDQLAESARLYLDDDALAGLLRPGFSEPGAEKLAVGCFEEPEFGNDPRIVEAILAWFARKRLPPDDIPGLCGMDLDMLEFINDYLRIHQPLPTIYPSSEMVDRIRRLYADLLSQTWPGTPVRDPFTVDHAHLLAQLDAASTVTRQVRDRLGELPGWLPPAWFDDGLVRPVLATPVFPRAMYQALLGHDPTWLLPGLDRVPEPDLVTVVASNPEFVEGFLTGLSHEMSRELLWRGYPADLRGTYFRRFWSGDTDELATELHRFDNGPLGSHLADGLHGFLVIVVRGELIRRHPDVLVMALQADSLDADGRPVFGGAGAVAPVVFAEHRAPDLLLVGFRLTAQQVDAAARGPSRWWFLLAEHPSAPRFGLDASSDNPHPAGHDELAWNHVTLAFDAFLDASAAAGPTWLDWGSSAAVTADLLLQNPVRAVFDAWELIQPALPGGSQP